MACIARAFAGRSGCRAPATQGSMCTRDRSSMPRFFTAAIQSSFFHSVFSMAK